MKTIYIIVFFLILEPFNLVLSGQTPDSCLKLLVFPEFSGFYNYDSIKVDSCPNSQTYLQLYAKKFFFVSFEYNVLPREGVFPEDTIIEYSWHDIDSGYASTKAGFQQLEEKLGQFWFIDDMLWKPDTTDDYKRQLSIRFQNYVNIDTAVAFIEGITFVNSCRYFLNIMQSVPDSSIMIISGNIFVYPQPAGDHVLIQGLNENIYDKLEIFSMTGYLLRSSEITPYSDIDFKTEDLPSGYYFLKIGKIILPLIISR
jgi:hypothetical protein